MWHRESDSLIVPMKAGNAAGGKEATQGSALYGCDNVAPPGNQVAREKANSQRTALEEPSLLD